MKKILFTISLLFSIILFSSDITFAEDKVVPASGEEAEQNIQGFNLQGYGEGGQKKWDLNGETANIDGDNVHLSNVVANTFGKENVNVTAKEGTMNQTTGEMNLKKDVVITSEQGTKIMTDSLSWDRNKDTVSTNDEVIITDSRKGMTMTGKGLEAQPGLKNARIQEDVAVRVNTEMKKADPNYITITSDGPMSIDQAKAVATFQDNVVAVQGDRTLKADRMEVYFDEKNKKIKQLLCIGHVEILQGENQTFADKATYLADEQKVVLSGRPKMIMQTEGNDGFAAFGN